MPILTFVRAAVLIAGGASLAAQSSPSLEAVSTRVDPYVDKSRVVVMTDIANEPDDQMSMVRFLVYSNQYDIEGLIASTSTWMRNKVRPDVINTLISAYAEVQPNLSKHERGFPPADALRKLIVSGQEGFGMAAVGDGKRSAGADLIITAAEKSDPRPLWVLAWGGANTLAQALLQARASRTPQQLDALIAKLRVYAISDQDDAGPWIRKEFPALHYIGLPSPPDGDQYYFATWTGISGDRFYKNAPGADFTTFEDAWVNEHIRSKGPLGKLYPMPCFIHEGDTPSFLGLNYSDDLIVLEITFISGRPKEKRLGLLKALNDAVVAAAGISPDDLMIAFYEVPGDNISFGRGLAQRADISAAAAS